MFILDTNVLSAMMSGRRVPEVAAWIEAQQEERLFTTTICQAEILSGLAMMTDGRRRTELRKAADEMFDEFEGRIFPFDTAAACTYADLFALRRKAGRPGAPLDLMIASIAHARAASVVTRDTSGFEGLAVAVINPWVA